VTNPPGLSIGDLAVRTGVGTSTLRMWESRHGFPAPVRLPSGHRRYDETAVEKIRQVQQRRSQGIRLDVAIHEAVNAAAPAPRAASPSVHALLRRHHGDLPVVRLRKTTLLGLSWAIEDEFAAVAPGSFLFGSFQRAKHYESARDRWEGLARSTTLAYAFADFDQLVPGRPTLVPLPDDHPMLREWFVVADGSEAPVVLSAVELPGQGTVADRDRVFEAVWGFDADAVRDASRTCAQVAADRDAPEADVAVEALADTPERRPVDLRSLTSLFNRAVGYVDSPRG